MRTTGKYRYLTFEDRKKIEAWHLIGDRPTDIAARLSGHYTTIYKELQRGATGTLDRNQREVDMAAFKVADISKAIAQRDAEIENLKKMFEREQEWRPLEDKDNVSQSEYAELATAGGTKHLTDD